MFRYCIEIGWLFVSRDRAVITQETLIVNERCQENVEHTLNEKKEVLVLIDNR